LTIPSPMPWAAPVTRATLSFGSMLSVSKFSHNKMVAVCRVHRNFSSNVECDQWGLISPNLSNIIIGCTICIMLISWRHTGNVWNYSW
jgi:hypothetical protein